MKTARICYTALRYDVKELRYKEKKGRRVKSVLGTGKRPERHLFFAHVSPKVASVPFPICKSALEKEMKNGSILAILLLPDTLPPMSAYVALPLHEHNGPCRVEKDHGFWGEV